MPRLQGGLGENDHTVAVGDLDTLDVVLFQELPPQRRDRSRVARIQRTGELPGTDLAQRRRAFLELSLEPLPEGRGGQRLCGLGLDPVLMPQQPADEQRHQQDAGQCKGQVVVLETACHGLQIIPVPAQPHRASVQCRVMIVPMRIDIFSDTVCPWCYLAKRRFDLALTERPQYEPRITWRAFELNLDLPAEGVDRQWFIANRVGDPARFAETQESLVSLGQAVGLDFRFERIRLVPNTRRTHLLILHARRSGLQSTVKERVMRAYFEEGADIGDVEVLVGLGVEAGLAENDARNAIVLRAGQDSVVAAERHAAALGITGVPTYVFDGKYTMSGAQEIGTLAQVLDQVAGMAAARDPQP